jgi:hypothetical protein
MLSKGEKTSKEQRKKEIIKYLLEKPGREEKEVLQYCLEKGIGSKVTVNEAIRELLEDEILDPGKERKNSKSYKLAVKSNNLLLIIPKDLDEIFEQFETLIDGVKQLEQVKAPINGSYKNLNKRRIKGPGPYQNVALSLQYHLIEIINDVYLFYFVTILPYLLKKDQINRLYLDYFEKIITIYSHISSNSSTTIQPSNPDEIQPSKLQEYYIQSKQESLHSRLYEVAKICENIGIEVELYDLLRELWSKNKKSTVLLYGLPERFPQALVTKQEVQDINDDTKYDFDKLIELFLSDIKNSKDMFSTKSDTMGI